MTTHNPLQAIQQLQSILSSPSKKIGFLFGAGISMKKNDGTDLIISMDDKIKKNEETGVETIIKEGMTTLAIKDFVSPQKEAIELMKKEIESVPNRKFNIETLLTIISEKEKAAGSEKLCGLSKTELIEMRLMIENKIVELISLHKGTSKVNIEDTNHGTFTKWISNADREFPVEIFTTNYDYFLELALEKERIAYFDGFIGGYEAFFCSEWIEDNSQKSPVKDWVKLWKLHGSLGWEQNDKGEIIRTSEKNGKSMIYPSFLKYDHSKKQPYLSYMDRLSDFLKQEDSVLFVSGYSFGDEHINDIITTSLNRSRSAHVFVLKSSNLKKEDHLFKDISQSNPKISVYSERNAVIGGKFGEWKLDREPDRNESYNILNYGFDEDATIPNKDKKYIYTGKGDFTLGDFKAFTEFLELFYLNSKYLKENEK